MFALVEVVNAPRAGPFRAIMDILRPEGAAKLSQQTILRYNITKVRIMFPAGSSGRKKRRRVYRAGLLLARMGFRYAVLPESFDYAYELQMGGITPVSTLSFHRTLAAEMVFCAMREKNLSPSATMVAVLAKRPTRELGSALIRVCAGARHIAVKIDYGGGGLCRTLRKDYGVPVIENPTRKQLMQADVLLVFNIPPDGDYLKEFCGQIILLCDPQEPVPEGLKAVNGAVFELSDRELSDALPTGYDRSALLAALVRMGLLRADQISVGSLIQY